MKTLLKPAVLKAAAVILILFIAFRINPLWGTMLLIVLFAFQMYRIRASLFTIKANRTYAAGNIDEAFKWYKKGSETQGAKPRLVTTYAYILLKEKHIDEAEAVLDKLSKTKLSLQDESQMKLTYSLVKWKQDKLDEAIEMLQEVHDKYKCSTSYESLGYMLILKGDYERALEFNLEAFDYNDSNNIILDNLAETYYFLQNYDKSFEIYEGLIKKEPTFAEPYYYYGLLLNQRGNSEEAISMLEKALSMKESFLSNLTKNKIEEALAEIKNPQ